MSDTKILTFHRPDAQDPSLYNEHAGTIGLDEDGHVVVEWNGPVTNIQLDADQAVAWGNLLIEYGVASLRAQLDELDTTSRELLDEARRQLAELRGEKGSDGE
jgi:hypothetical protein